MPVVSLYVNFHGVKVGIRAVFHGLFIGFVWLTMSSFVPPVPRHMVTNNVVVQPRAQSQVDWLRSLIQYQSLEPPSLIGASDGMSALN